MNILRDMRSRCSLIILMNQFHALGSAIEMTLLRIAQESMTNVARHAHANQIILSLQQEENTIRMTIQDNGVGILSLEESTRSW